MAKNILVTGSIGAGKSCAVIYLLQESFEHIKGVGGLLLDFKGDLHLEVIRLAKKHHREEDIVILEVSDDGTRVYPQQRLNLLTINGMSPEIVAQILADISTKGESRGKHSEFFKDQCITHIAAAIRLLEQIGSPVTIPRLFSFLTDRYEMLETLKRLGGHNEKTPEGRDIWIPNQSAWVDHWFNSFLSQPSDQLGGVISSIANSLSALNFPAIAEVFGSDLPNTVNFNEIDQGRIFVVTCPHTMPKSKAALNQFLKSVFFFSCAKKFDQRKHGIHKDDRLSLLFLDEFQKSVSPTDQNFMDVLRDVGACYIAATQDTESLIPVLGKDLSNVITSKFRTRIVFRSESWASANNSADILGKKRVWKISRGYSNGKSSSNRSESDEYIIRPEYFHARLKDHRCCIIHPSGKFRKNVKLPLV